jgi:hypothetical protein
LHGYIYFPIDFSGKVVNCTFVVIPTYDQFKVKLDLTWMNAMQYFSSPIYQCIIFPYDGKIKKIKYSLHHPSRP